MDIFEVKLIEVPDLFKVSIITGTSIIVNSDNTYNAIEDLGEIKEIVKDIREKI